MKKFLILLILLLAGGGWAFVNHQKAIQESGGTRFKSKGAEITGYDLVQANDPKSVVLRDLQVSRVPDGLRLSFELASLIGVNNYPTLVVTLINRDGSRRLVKLSPTAYAHPDGKLTKTMILVTVPVTGNEANVSIEAVYP